MKITELIFWISLGSLAYTFLFYPLLLNILWMLTGKRKVLPEPTSWPAISILIPAYNEEKVIRQKLESIFNSDYPRSLIEVIVGSDASTDGTEEIVRSFTNVRLQVFKGRSGKPAIINALSAQATHPVLILTDANVIFESQTLKELVRPFQNPEVGLVDSRMQNIASGTSGVSGAESTYIRGESRIKFLEGELFGSMIGPFGGCFAVRKSLYSLVPENFLVDDFYINMKVLAAGYRALTAPAALVFEENPSDWKVEFRRKIRIAAGSYQNYLAFLPLFFRFNATSFCLLSHKLIRWKSPFLLLTIYLCSALLAMPSVASYEITGFWPKFSEQPWMAFYLWFFLFQNAVLLLAAFDLILVSLKIPFFTRLLTHFLTTNLALLLGFFKFISGIRTGIWQPTRR